MGNKIKYRYNNKKKVKGRRRFQCMCCMDRFLTFDDLLKHTQKYHKDEVGDQDIYRFLYEKRNPGPYICVICKKNPREWNPIKKKYNRICNNPDCIKKSREAFSKNMKKIYGTDNLLADPERQAELLANRSISGRFKFLDGVEIVYVGQYELDFLKHAVEKFNYDSTDIIECPSKLYLKYYDIYTKKDRYYIPDFYIPKYNLVIEIKDGSKYPLESKAKAILKEDAVIKAKKFNYIKIVDKNYTDFDNFITDAIENHFTNDKKDNSLIFIIPDSSDLL